MHYLLLLSFCMIKVTFHPQRPKKSIFLLFEKTEYKY